jgi:hypothetical protein
MDWKTGFRIPAGKDFSLVSAFETAVESRILGTISLGTEQPEHEANHPHVAKI